MPCSRPKSAIQHFILNLLSICPYCARNEFADSLCVQQRPTRGGATMHWTNQAICRQCKCGMQTIATIDSFAGNPGLVAFQCAACGAASCSTPIEFARPLIHRPERKHRISDKTRALQQVSPSVRAPIRYRGTLDYLSGAPAVTFVINWRNVVAQQDTSQFLCLFLVR